MNNEQGRVRSLGLDISSTVFDMTSECTMTLLVLMLANGWYSRYFDFDYDEGIEVYGPLFLLIIVVHIMFGCFTLIDKDAYHKFHDFSGWPGALLIVTKLILVCVFIYFHSYTKIKV